MSSSGPIWRTSDSGPLRATTGQNVREYESGETLTWAWEVPCQNHRWGRDVPYEDVKAILKRGNVRIRSGLMEISQAQFDEIRRRLKL